MGAKDKEKSQKRQRNKFRKIQKMEQGIRWDDKWIKQYLEEEEEKFQFKAKSIFTDTKPKHCSKRENFLWNG